MNEVSDNDVDDPEIGKWDPGLTERVMGVLRPVLKTYFRSEVRGLDCFPPGGALVVGNHSGGMFAMDVPIFSVDFYEKFGYDRPVYTLSHDILFMGVAGPFFRRTGYIRANPENAATALRSGGVVVVFPGGDYDAYRPTFSENVIDFNGRKGYVRTAIEVGVPLGLIDELGTLTWQQLDERINALATARQQLPAGRPKIVGIMCPNHRGFVEALVAANRTGSDIFLLNTSFAGPALADQPDATRIVAWTDGQHDLTVEELIAAHAGQLPEPSGRKGRRTWPTTRCPAKLPSSTSFPAAAPTRSSATNCNHGLAADAAT